MNQDTLTEAIARIAKRTQVVEDACWIWMGQVNNWGYGVISVKNVKKAVHRVVYEEIYGPIPQGLVIDHTCRNRVCVNPSHLQAITSGENVSLGKLRNTQCPKGHPYSGDNLFFGAEFDRRCRVCHNANQRHYKAAKKLRETQ